jgi:hypothetical protein
MAAQMANIGRFRIIMAGCAGQNFIVEIRRSGTKRHQNLNLILLLLNGIKKMAHFFRASMVRR